MASCVIPPIEDEGPEVDGAVEVRGATISIRGCPGLSCVALRRTKVASVAHMNVKCGDSGLEIEKWRRILVIAEEKKSLS